MKKGLILCLAAVVAVPASAVADNITINSSSSVTYLSNGSSTTTDFPSAFTSTNFQSAQTGAHAAVLTSTPTYTTASALTTAGAQWIATSAGGGSGATPAYTALFAISFTIPDAFMSGTLNLNYEVDNILGLNQPGIYLNGIALPNSTAIPGNTGSSYTALHTYTASNIAADIVQGTNWLYIDAVNTGGPGGLIFSANVSTVNTPEPASTWLFGIGLVALGAALLQRNIAIKSSTI